MKNRIIVVLVLAGCCMCHSVNAQQDALFTQYIDAQLYSNPAAAGSNDHITIAGIHRQQWAGFQGAPMTSGLMIHSPLHYESVGIGLDLWNDRLGTLNRTTAAANFAYRFKFKNGGKLSLGVKAIADFNFSDVTQVSNAVGDPRADALQKSVTPNAGVGILYKSPKWFMGLGVPRLLKNDTTSFIDNGGYVNQMQAYLLAGALVKMKGNWIFRPSLQVRGAIDAPLSIDVSTTFIANEKLYFGLNYRLFASVGFIAQFQLNPQVKLGYSFDLGTTAQFRTTHFGSHEVMLSYDMNFSKASVISPRLF